VSVCVSVCVCVCMCARARARMHVCIRVINLLMERGVLYRPQQSHTEHKVTVFACAAFACVYVIGVRENVYVDTRVVGYDECCRKLRA